MAVYNTLGEAVIKMPVTGLQVVDLNLSSYPAGLYNIIITDGKDAVYRGKIMKQ